MLRRRSIAPVMILFSLICSWPTGAFAQAPVSSPDRDAAVERMIGIALDNIHRALCDDRKPCAPATAEEKASPPLTVAEGRMVVQRGVLSAAGEHCGLDWRKLNFLPLMSYWRDSRKVSERKLALISLLHGIMQGASKPQVEAGGPCTDTRRREIEARLAFRP